MRRLPFGIGAILLLAGRLLGGRSGRVDGRLAIRGARLAIRRGAGGKSNDRYREPPQLKFLDP
jgi:hypothetical protein